MRTTLASVWALSLFWLAGCSLVADFDRSKIKQAVHDAGLDAAGMDAASFDAAGIDAAPFLMDGSTTEAGTDSAVPTDAGMDAQTLMDAGSDAGSDAGADAGTDAGADAAVDAGTDAAVDAGADASVDAGQDAGTDTSVPECGVPTDCGTGNGCFFFTCVDGTCGIANLDSGQDATLGQATGNCKRRVCDGSGGVSEINDNADVFNDGKQCTTDTCNNGTPENTPVTSGNSCSQNGGSVCSSGGNCVQCLQASDCGTNTDCVTYSCTGAFTCQQSYTSAGTPTTSSPAQVSGDCKTVQCNGSGGTQQVADTGDVFNDSLECTVDACDGTTVLNTPKDLGTPCTQGSGTSCNATGQCVSCTQDSDCGTDNDCATYTCNTGACEQDNAPMGTLTTSNPAQVSGDCNEYRCNNSGVAVPVPLDSDVENDSKECTVDTCNAGNPVHTPKTTGDACGQGGGDYCAADGDCVACITASDCGTDDDCVTYTCSVDGVCGQTNTQAGTPTTGDPAQVAGDCTQIQCNGSGLALPVSFDADTPANDNVICTDELCSGGNPVFPDSDPGTACDDGGSGNVCDDSGNCVECLDDTDCGSSICIDQVCVTPGSLSALSASPSVSTLQETTSITFSFTTANKWPANGAVSIVFGSAFDVSGATFTSLSGAAGSLAVNVVGQEVLLTRSAGTTTAAGANLSVTLGGIVNPSSTGTTATFAIETRNGAGTAIDDGLAGGYNVTPGTLTSAAAMLANAETSATGMAFFNFTLAHDWPVDGTLQIVFPSELDVSAATLQVLGGADGTFDTQVSGQTVTVSHVSGGQNTAAATPILVTIASVTNPAIPTTPTTGTFTVTTYDDLAAAVDTVVIPGVAIVSPP